MNDPRFYLVIDLEATTSDDASLPPEQMETIEIGAVLADARTLAVVDEFQSFVQPVRHPKLLPFVTKLTDITQAMVDAAPLFPEAFASLRVRLIDHRHPLVFGSWGRYNRIQCARLRAARRAEQHAAAPELEDRVHERAGAQEKAGHGRGAEALRPQA